MEKNIEKNIEVKLSLDAKIQENILDLEKEIMVEDLKNIPPVKEGEISFEAVYMFDNGSSIEVNLYILNGLNTEANFGEIPFIINNNEGQVIIQQIFDLKAVGIIPPYSARPHKIYFDKNNFDIHEFSLNECKLTIGNGIGATQNSKIQLENVSEKTPVNILKGYQNHLDNLPLIREEEIRVSTYDVFLNENGDINVTMFISNGSSKLAKIKSIPVTVVDANKRKIVGGVFNIDNIEVNPYKARIYNFAFTSTEFLIDGFDMSNISVIYR